MLFCESHPVCVSYPPPQIPWTASKGRPGVPARCRRTAIIAPRGPSGKNTGQRAPPTLRRVCAVSDIPISEHLRRMVSHTVPFDHCVASCVTLLACHLVSHCVTKSIFHLESHTILHGKSHYVVNPFCNTVSLL